MHSKDIEWSSASCSNESPWVKDTCVDVQLELLGSFFFIFYFCRFGKANGSMPIFLSGVKCSSAHQLHTLRCRHNEIGSTSDCNHAQDVVLYCGKL